MPHHRRVPTAIAVVAVLALAGCASGADSDQATGSGAAPATGTSCNLSGCTVVLQRGVDARASVLGVPVELVGVTGNQVTLKVANQQVSVPLDPNASANVGGLAVSVQSADKDRVVLKVTAGG